MIKSLFRISVSVGLHRHGAAASSWASGRISCWRRRTRTSICSASSPCSCPRCTTASFPQAAASRLARYQAVVSVVGAILFPVGIACVLLGGHDRFEPVVVAGALTVFAGMVLFAMIVYRTAGSGSPAAAGQAVDRSFRRRKSEPRASGMPAFRQRGHSPLPEAIALGNRRGQETPGRNR